MQDIYERGTPPLLMRISEVMSALGLGRTKINELIATGELPVVRIGRAVRISSSALEQWIHEQQ